MEKNKENQEQNKAQGNPILNYIKRDLIFILVCVIALGAVLYAFVGTGTADAVKACNDHWIKQWNEAAKTMPTIGKINSSFGSTPIYYESQTNN